jgi:uncharacterized hydrophobic protein (TIGR00271 family)
MLQLRVVGQHRRLSGLGSWLEDHGHARNTTLVPALNRVDGGLLVADIGSESTSDVLAYLDESGVSRDDITVFRLEEIGPAHPHAQSASSLIWADMVGFAQRNARPLARYVVFMTAAGVIAGYGVTTVNSTLIVGAMAVSPDTLPLAAACVGIVGGRWRLALRSFGTLVVGLAIAAVAAALIALLLRVTGRLPQGFSAEAKGLAGLVTVGVGTVGVALAAGVAAMLALETRASSAVGVAISVTTIPAAAYVGVALAVDQRAKAGGAVAVLGLNVAMLLVGGTATLLVQRWLDRRRRAEAAAARRVRKEVT